MEILLDQHPSALGRDLRDSIESNLCQSGKETIDAPVTRTASAAAKPCQGDSFEFYLITGSFPDGSSF
ncbi:hypothetical protein Tco_0418550 [Tanacetum coccineum]